MELAADGMIDLVTLANAGEAGFAVDTFTADAHQMFNELFSSL